MKLTLVDDVRAIYKRWSVQFAVLAGALLTAAVANRDDVVAFLNSLPAQYQPFVPILTLIFSIGAPVLLVALKQPKLEAAKQDQAEG